MLSVKILLLSPSFEAVGGVSSFCRMLTENLNSDFQVEHLQVGNPPGNNNLFRRINILFRNAAKLKKKLKENQYDIVHLNPSFEIFSLLRDTFYLKSVNRHHHGSSLVMFHGWNEILANAVAKTFFLKWIFKCIYQRSGSILVLCNPFKAQMMNMGIASEKVKVITTMYEGKIPDREKRPVEDGSKIRLLFMSRLERSKGVYIVVDVAKMLVEDGDQNFSLIAAGGGPEYNDLVQYISDNHLDEYIRAPGYVRGLEKEMILEGSDIFLYPSHYGEGCPLVILEAMGAGLAVVSTPVAAIPEIVRHEENGFIVDSQDPKDFYKSVKTLIENRDLLSQMQRANRKKAEENYEAKVVTRKMEGIYRSLSEDVPAGEAF